MIRPHSAAQVWVAARVPGAEAAAIYDCMFAALSSLSQLQALTVEANEPPTPVDVEALPALDLLDSWLAAPRLTHLDVDVRIPLPDVMRCHLLLCLSSMSLSPISQQLRLQHQEPTSATNPSGSRLRSQGVHDPSLDLIQCSSPVADPVAMLCMVEFCI